MSYDFNGTTQYLYNNGTPVTAMPFTLACWVKPDTLPGGAYWAAMSVCDGTSNTEHYLLGGYGAAATAFIRSTAGSYKESRGGTMTTGAWQHIAAVFTSSTSRTSYLNGVANTPETSSVSPTTPTRVAIGCNYRNAIVNYFDGLVCHAATWDVALDATAITALAAGAAPSAVSAGDLVSYVPLTASADPQVDSVWA